MKIFYLVLAFALAATPVLARTIIVDYYGGGQYTSIQPAIDAAASGDTVKVWPGPIPQGYVGQINLNRNITLMGSGYESTLITSNANPTVLMSSGRLQWFKISSTGGDGVVITGGILLNCVINGCSTNGVRSTSGSSSVINCVVACNGGYGVYTPAGTISATNCIARPNGGTGFYGYYGDLNLSYCNGSRGGTNGNQGCIDVDPGSPYSCADVRIPENSLGGWDLGNPSILDPDGSRSDMGYFGGPDCPISPTVFEILLTPGTGNTVNLQAKGRANY